MNPAIAEDNPVLPEHSLLQLDSLPLGVKHFLLECSGGTELLKTFRLVSRSWNEISCWVLRNVSAVSVTEGDEESLEKLKDVLLDRLISFPSDWPNPFQNLKLLEASFTTPGFVRFVQRPGFRVTTLAIIHGKEFSLDVFETIVKKHKESIVRFKIKCNREPATTLRLSEELVTGWRSLKFITLKDLCDILLPCPHMDLLTALADKRSIQGIILEGNLDNISSIFAQKKNCWDSLSKMALECKEPPADVTAEQISGFMKWAGEIKFPSLSNLTLWFSTDTQAYQTAAEYAPHILPLIQGSSPVLEQLRVTFLPLSFLPSCPKLTTLCCSLLSGDRIQDISELKFPSLSSIHCCIRWNEIPDYVKPTEADSQHGNVTFVTISWDANPPQGAVDTIWSSLRDHFPNLKKIWIQGCVSFATLTLVKRALPQLQDIEIRSISLAQLLGPDLASEAAAAKGWPYQDVGGCPLLEMTELTHLRLGLNVVVSPELINCVRHLPKIQFLKFHWNVSLKDAGVKERLDQIKEVIIVYKEKWEKRELDGIFKATPCFKLEKYQP